GPVHAGGDAHGGSRGWSFMPGWCYAATGICPHASPPCPVAQPVKLFSYCTPARWFCSAPSSRGSALHVMLAKRFRATVDQKRLPIQWRSTESDGHQRRVSTVPP